jgi:hypothetical protein
MAALANRAICIEPAQPLQSNTPFFIPHHSSMIALHRTFLFSILGLLWIHALLPSAWAQEANVLGLPVVPQTKAGVPIAPQAGAPEARPGGPSRSPLTGELSLEHSALAGIGRLVITSKATFQTAQAKKDALAAAQAVQRGLPASCGRQCKPEKMAAPHILPSGNLKFEVVFHPLHQHLSQAQFSAILGSRPLNLSAEQLTPPKPAK